MMTAGDALGTSVLVAFGEAASQGDVRRHRLGPTHHGFSRR